jgi:hypothetical protein
MVHRKRRLAVVAATALLGMAGAGAALAQLLSSPPTRENQVAAAGLDEAVNINADRIKLQTKGPTDVYVDRFTFANAGDATPWHHHHGVGLLAVKQGRILFQSDCSSGIYGPPGSGAANGQVFIESGEAEAVKATALEPNTVVWTTFVIPDGAPFAVPAPAPDC